MGDAALRHGGHIGRQRVARGADLRIWSAVPQRLEQMMVASIDDRDRDIDAGEPARGLESAETAADDHQVRPTRDDSRLAAAGIRMLRIVMRRDGAGSASSLLAAS